MIVGVADTHTAIWHLFGDVRLSKAAATFNDTRLSHGGGIPISSVTLAEIVYLVEKKRLPQAAYDDLKAVLLDPAHVFKEHRFNDFPVNRRGRRIV